MMFKRVMRQLTGVTAGMLLLIMALLVIAAFHARTLAAQTSASASASTSDTIAEPLAPLAVSQVLSYQARLLDPTTGEPKPDGDYQMTFSIYNVAAGGSPLWTETKSVAVSNGFLTSLLGDTTTLILNNFNGQELFLGITLAGDPEMTPRQRLAHTAYAMFAENAGKLDDIDSTGFAAATHSHSGAAISSGIVAAARIDGAIARDAEDALTNI